LDIIRISRRGRAQAAVKGDDPFDVRAAASEFQRAGAAEAIADDGDILLLHILLRLELIEPRLQPLAEERAIALVFARQFAGRFWIGGAHTLAVDVRG